MLSELERLIELGKLIGQRSNHETVVTVNINTWSIINTTSVEVWIFFYDENHKEITATYHYDDKPYTLNILTMMFNEVREK